MAFGTSRCLGVRLWKIVIVLILSGALICAVINFKRKGDIDELKSDVSNEFNPLPVMVFDQDQRYKSQGHTLHDSVTPIEDSFEVIEVAIADKSEIAEILQLSKCPICFGRDLCQDFDLGVISFTNESVYVNKGSRKEKVEYTAVMGTDDLLTLKTLRSTYLKQFENVVCKLGGFRGKAECSLRVAAHVAAKAKQFDLNIDTLQEFHKMMGRNRTDFPLVLCPSDKLLKSIKTSFSHKGIDRLTPEESAVMLTTMAVFPEAAVLRFLTQEGLDVPAPHYLGACGRVIATEGNLRPVTEFIHKPFPVRAKLASHLLAMVEDFLDDDPDWMILFTNLTYDNLVVSDEGELLVRDVGDMAIIDKDLITGNSSQESSSEKPCNAECFRKFTADVYSASDTSDICSRIDSYASLMFALVCQQILSDLPEHRISGYFMPDKVSKQNFHSLPGLLHSPPPSLKVTIEELLIECVEETAGGGREGAAGELQDMLSEVVGVGLLNHGSSESFVDVE